MLKKEEEGKGGEGGAQSWPSWLADEEKFRFQMVYKDKITLETISFWRNVSTSIHTAVNEKRKTEKSCTLLYN